MPEGGEKKTLRWDEENLEFNEENKTPKMKIDEPPTPFNFDYCDDELLDDEGERPAEPVQERSGPTLSFAAELEGKMSAIASDPDSVQPTIVATEEEEEARRAAFAANRAAHYNMAAALRGHVSFASDDSGEGEEEDGEEGGANLAPAGEGTAGEDEDEGLDAAARKEKFAQKRKAFYMARDREAAERAKQVHADMAAEFGPDGPAEK